MIRVINHVGGRAIWVTSLSALYISPSLRSQLGEVKRSISIALESQIRIPENLASALVIIEDQRYYRHYGVDFYSIARALLNNLASARTQGASTIVQQLVRNVTGQRQRTVKRKVREIMLASLVDNIFSKDDLMTAYVQTYPFKGIMGALTYFPMEGYSFKDLPLLDAAEIAARFKFPNLNFKNYIRYLKRVRIIEMQLQG